MNGYQIHAAAPGDNAHTLCGLTVVRDPTFGGWEWNYRPPLAKQPHAVSCPNCLELRYKDRHP